MQIAKGIIVTTPENQLVRYDITPAEAVILKTLHWKYSNGSPLRDLVVCGEAETIEVPEKAAEPAWFNQLTGKHVPEVPAVPAKKHKRTNAEEVERLKRKYTGVIKGKTAFEAAFGSAAGVKLPQKFNDVKDIIGDIVTDPNERLEAEDEPVVETPRRGRPPRVEEPKPDTTL